MSKRFFIQKKNQSKSEMVNALNGNLFKDTWLTSKHGHETFEDAVEEVGKILKDSRVAVDHVRIIEVSPAKFQRKVNVETYYEREEIEGSE